MSTVEPGTPCWADLATPDLADAKRFYPQLFGWTGRVSPEPEAGGYTVFLKGGRAVAGAGPPATPDQVPIWSTYVATDDADLAATRVEAAGGQVVVAPFDVLDQGRMAVLADPAGAVFSVWQPMAMRGAELFNVPGAMCWNELVSPDPEGAKEFYALVFGWQPEDQQVGSITYTGWRCGARVVAGMMPPLAELPADLPAYWSVYFSVEDADATAARAAELGGTILVPPRDNPAGRTAALRDPQGALFSITALS
ncbi:VOC family protein [Micromonospora coerulea]|uniref:VOC family protein n=1 Tax=Micromonospora coerulea TaxID=47856 RepID=A0ABP8ST67_9ACTN|nr:VOC family protein [Micromonospora veneta]